MCTYGFYPCKEFIWSQLSGNAQEEHIQENKVNSFAGLKIIGLGQKMLERSYSYKLPSIMKYVSNSFQNSSALKKGCWSGECLQWRGQPILLATKMKPMDSPLRGQVLRTITYGVSYIRVTSLRDVASISH